MIQLHVDLAVDPAKEADMLRHFHAVFRPAAAKFEGYFDVSLLKYRTAFVGEAPEGMTYRFSITYQSEELRQKWVTSSVHGEVWAPIEEALSSPNYTVLLFDLA